MPLKLWRARLLAGVSSHAVLIRQLGADPRKCRIVRTIPKKPEPASAA